jgi:hypothetical protein
MKEKCLWDNTEERRKLGSKKTKHGINITGQAADLMCNTITLQEM